MDPIAREMNNNIKTIVTSFGLGVTVFCCSLAVEAASPNPVLGERALRAQCSAESLSQVQLRECLEKKANESEKTLKQAEQIVLDRLLKWDEDDRYVALSKRTLDSSGKVFVQYRKAQCEFAMSMRGGGAGDSHEISRLACIAEMNNRRAEQLRDAVSELPQK